MRTTRHLGEILVLAIVATTLLALAPTPLLAKDALTVYTTTASEDLKKYRDRFNKSYPNIDIRWVRDSTGIITSKLLAEKANPQADVIHVLAVTSLTRLVKEGLLLPYKPKDYDRLDPRFKDRGDPPHWAGNLGFVSTICYNTIEGKKKNIPRPTTWKDLLSPAYKGQIVMSDPNSSGTAFLNISAWIQTWGEDETWKFLDKLHENIAVYVHSGSQPCVMAAQGEFPVALSFDLRGVKEKSKGAPIDVISPSEALGWEMNGSAIVKGTKNLEAAKVFMDWATSDEGNKLYGEDYALIARPDLAKPVQFYPENATARIIRNDFYWASDHHNRIVAEWTKRYAAKSAPK
jgi:iron(III) transport system substrate-binding protein